MNEAIEPKKKSIVVRMEDKELIEQLCQRSRQAALAWIRDVAEHPFWWGGDTQHFTYYDFGRFLRIKRSENLDLPSIARALTRCSPMMFRTFEANWTGGDRANPSLRVHLNDQVEWPDVLNEAWEELERPPYNLSEQAGKLLKWAEQKKNQHQWVDPATIGRQALLRGTSWTLEYLAKRFTEIQAKANVGLKVDQNTYDFRVSFGRPSPIEPPKPEHGPLNPVLKADFTKVEFAELDRFKEELYDWILAANLPNDSTLLAIWRFHDRATLFRCFPSWGKDHWNISTLSQFLGEVRLEHGLTFGYSFVDPQPWYYVVGPRQEGVTWNDIKARISKARNSPPLTEQYGISKDAAALLRWFTTLKPNEWTANLTPAVEKKLKVRIGISIDLEDKNFGIFLSLLAEEISDKTEWKVTVHSWKDRYSDITHRLSIRRKPTSFDEVVKQIQMLAISEGKVIGKEKVQTKLRGMLDSVDEGSKPVG